MPATCIVRGCKSRSNQGCGIKFHRLPWRDEMLCKQWLIRAGKSELELTGKRMSQFKNARMCSLHFNADGEGTSTTLPSINIPDFERQEAAAGLVQLAVSHMESNQRNVNGDQINPDNSTEDIGNVLEAAEGLIPITKPKTTANDDVIITQPPLITPGQTYIHKVATEFGDTKHN